MTEVRGKVEQRGLVNDDVGMFERLERRLEGRRGDRGGQQLRRKSKRNWKRRRATLRPWMSANISALRVGDTTDIIRRAHRAMFLITCSNTAASNRVRGGWGRRGVGGDGKVLGGTGRRYIVDGLGVVCEVESQGECEEFGN